MRTSFAVVCSLVLAFVAQEIIASEPAELRGASEVIRTVEADAGTSAPLSPQLQTVQQLLDRLERFEQKRATLPSEEAARNWLQLLDDARAKSDSEQMLIHPWQPYVQQLIYLAMPGPDVWPEISKQIDAREVPVSGKAAMQAHALRMMGHLLTGDRKLQQADAEAMHKLIESRQPGAPSRAPFGFTGVSPDQMTYYYSQAWPLIWHGLKNADPDSVVKLWLEMKDSQSYTPESQDLVALVGEAKAKPAIEKLVATVAGSKEKLYSLAVGSGPGSKVIKAEVLKQLDKFSYAPWLLINAPADRALYEAIAKQFPEDRSPERASADMQYLAALVHDGEIDEAVKLYQGSIGAQQERDNDDSDQSSYYFYSFDEQGGKQKQYVAEFYAKLINAQSPIGLWRNYLSSAIAAGKVTELITSLEAALPDAPSARQGELEAILVDALLADDRVDDALARMQKIIADVKPAEATAAQFDAALRIARVGKLTGRAEIENAGTQFALEAIRSKAPLLSAAERPHAYSQYTPSQAWEQLVESGHPAAAETLLMNELVATAQQHLQTPERYNGYLYDSRTSAPQVLGHLAQLYADQERTDDVLKLLNGAPWWGAGDVAELDLGTEQKVAIAKAFVALGQRDVALKMVEQMLAKSTNDDGPYELLLELKGQDALADLDALFARDQFQERPLIWKAKLLLDAGKLDEAEQTAREAIAIDPSDGEQGKGSRMIVYGVLADILDKQGGAKNRDEAAIYRQAVKAIRLAEHADDFRTAGLHDRAIETYEAALELFVDAYCIQSRLAIELATAGRTKEASEHFRKAFELMPVSFGRVESHCFGCEGVFDAELAQQIAEDVFTKLVKEQPDNPRVHYLLGYLRQSQQRPADALVHFRKAVELDPDYYNAWDHLYDISGELGQPDKDALLAMVRLKGPSILDYRSQFTDDLATIWRLLETRTPEGPEPPKTIYPLAAAAQALAEQKKNASRPTEDASFAGLTFRGKPIAVDMMSGVPEQKTPAAALFQGNPLFMSINHLLQANY